MAIKFPERNYFTLSELMKRWGCEENDIRGLIVTGELKLSCLINHVANLVTLVDAVEDGRHYWSFQQVVNDVLHEDLEDQETFKYKMVSTKGFYYFLLHDQTGAFDCRFPYFSEDRNYVPGSDTPCLMFTGRSKEWDMFTELSVALARGVFSMEEVAAFEARQGKTEQPPSAEKPLGTTEKNTLLTIVAALAKAQRIDIYQPGRAAVAIEDLTDKLGAHVSKRAIEEHLKKIPNALETRMK